MVLFLSPEQLARDEVVARLGEQRVAHFVVDEAHCISAWGHDFRPDYLRLGTVVDRLGHPPVLALTATAPRPVREEVAERLHLRDPLVLVRGFDRPNLHLDVRRHVEDSDRREAVVDTVAGLEGTVALAVPSTRALSGGAPLGALPSSVRSQEPANAREPSRATRPNDSFDIVSDVCDVRAKREVVRQSSC